MARSSITAAQVRRAVSSARSGVSCRWMGFYLIRHDGDLGGSAMNAYCAAIQVSSTRAGCWKSTTPIRGTSSGCTSQRSCCRRPNNWLNGRGSRQHQEGRRYAPFQA